MGRRRRHSGIELVVLAVILYTAWQHPIGRALLAAGIAAALIYLARWYRKRFPKTPAATGNRPQVADLYQLSPTDFEHAVADLLRQAGWRTVEVTGGAGDLGADITGLLPDGRRGIVQAKRYRPGNRVGSRTVQTMIGMAAVHHKACVGMIVTTSSYTRKARELGDAHPQFILVDGSDLERPDLLQRLANPTAEPTRR